MNVLDKATTVAETKYVHDKLQGEIDAIAKVIKIESWTDVQKIVRAGMAAKFFTVGDQLTCQKDGTNLVWDVIGIDHDTPADPQYTHSMTLQLHDTLSTRIQFDNPEALYYAESELAAGTYHFAIDSAGYQFTLSDNVPAGGQLILAYSGGSPSTISIASTKGGAATGSIAVTSGSGGTTLTAVNSPNRMKYGSNRYKESSLRQWLNSDGAAGSVWSPQNDYGRPPAWAANTAGFMNGLDADFLAVIGNTKLPLLKTPSQTAAALKRLTISFSCRQEARFTAALKTALQRELPIPTIPRTQTFQKPASGPTATALKRNLGGSERLCQMKIIGCA